MPALENPRYERMAQERYKGASVTDAHEKAGFKRNRGNAAKINALECVQKRIAELQALGEAELVKEIVSIDKGYVLQQAHRLYKASADAACGEDGFDPRAANVASRFLDQIGRHVDIQAWRDHADLNVTVTIDQAIDRLAAIEGDFEVLGADGGSEKPNS